MKKYLKTLEPALQADEPNIPCWTALKKKRNITTKEKPGTPKENGGYPQPTPGGVTETERAGTMTIGGRAANCQQLIPIVACQAAFHATLLEVFQRKMGPYPAWPKSHNNKTFSGRGRIPLRWPEKQKGSNFRSNQPCYRVGSAVKTL